MTEFWRVVERVVAGDCEALSSVQSLSSLSSSTPRSKRTPAWSISGELLRRGLAEAPPPTVAALLVLPRLVKGSRSLLRLWRCMALDEAWRGKWPLEWFLRNWACDVLRETTAADALRFKAGRAAASAVEVEVEPVDRVRWWCWFI